MRDVSIVGIGQTKVGEKWDKSIRDLSVEAINKALKDSNINRDEIDSLYAGNMLSGKVSEQENLGAMISDFAGLGNIPSVKVEAACASGGAALQVGAKGVMSGMEDLTIVVGVEKLTDVLGSKATEGLAYAADQEFETFHGATFVSLNAIATRMYINEFDVDREDLMRFAVNAHSNAVNNPNAMFRNEINLQKAINSPVVADPLRLMDVTPVCDGAAAVILAPKEKAQDYTDTPIDIAGMGNAVDSIGLHDRETFKRMPATEKASENAYKMANMEPNDIDVIEPHDAFTIMTALGLEDMGFVEKGKAVKAAREGRISINGDLPINTMGGLKARGHPVGATGIYQTVEIVQQLRGEAGENQVDEAKSGIAQNIGGTGSNITVNIFERGD